MSELLKNKIRSVTEKDKTKLKKYSYSGLSVLKQCPYQFNLKYNKGLKAEESTLALQLGTLLHYVLEQKGKMLVEYPSGLSAEQYQMLDDILRNGTEITDEKTKEKILGLNELKKIYWETWGIPDTEGRTYNDKIELFQQVVKEEMENTDWKPYLFEHPFEFVYDDKIILHGFIDRVDRKEDDSFRVVDYKTNKKLFAEKDLPTSLQFGIYALAMLNEFGVVPEEYQYRLILLGKEQYALTLGWEKRLVKALDKIIENMEEYTQKNEWIPNPTPLCHWCSYCRTNGDAKQYKDECPYYSLWTPDNKVFEVNQKYDPFKIDKKENNTLQNKRYVIF